MPTARFLLTASVYLCCASTAAAQVVCVRNSPNGGPIRARATCKASETQLGSLAAFQLLLGAISSEDAGATLRLTGVNLQVVSGSGSSDGPVNGRGNLVLGYNTDNLGDGADAHTGSHNLVIGDDHSYTSSGGLVGGLDNEISATGATVLTGNQNTASSIYAAVTTGGSNVADGLYASVTGGYLNQASGPFAAVSGGAGNDATGSDSSVSGGLSNVASNNQASVCGGRENEASGPDATVSGGFGNEAAGENSAVSGGNGRSAAGVDDWAAGGLAEDF
jgi:hypothetical protein